MIPYFPPPALELGPLTIHGFGIMVVVAILVGSSVLRRTAKRWGLDPDLAARLVTAILISGFIGAHLVDRLVYFPGETFEDPWSVLRIWEGLSSFGGFLGAVTAAVFFVRRGVLGDRRWEYLDAVAFAFPFGWLFGRLGCFIAYDHPGEPTDFFLGQVYQDGVVRHNLGFEEAIYTAVLAAVFALLTRRARPPGFYAGLLAVLYAPVRFGLDFLRAIDVRYLGLTPGQWGAILLMAIGFIVLSRTRHRSKRVAT